MDFRVLEQKLRSRKSFAQNMKCQEPAVGGEAVFPKVKSLPGAQSEAATQDRDADVNAGQGAPNVCGHVVGAFGGVME